MGNAASRKRRKKLKNKTILSPQYDDLLNIYDNIDTSQKRYDPNDGTLRIVDREDEMDFLYLGYDSLRAEMSCGHAVTPQSLTDWCFKQLDDGQCNFVCGNCNKQWSLQEVYKMALLTPEEVECFERKIFENAADSFLGVKRCPGCNSLATRRDQNNLSVACSVCTARTGRSYAFCWQCMKEWKGPASSERCENEACQSPLNILKHCKTINFMDVKGVHGCPAIRACPICGTLLEHSKRNCRSLVCTRCKTKFCFVCLSATQECLSKPYEMCPNGVAPRQTTIPVWKQKN